MYQFSINSSMKNLISFGKEFETHGFSPTRYFHENF